MWSLLCVCYYCINRLFRVIELSASVRLKIIKEPRVKGIGIASTSLKK